MTRHLYIFLGTFAIGALVALGARTASHQPHGAPAQSQISDLKSQIPAKAHASADPHASHRSSSSAPSQISDPHSQVSDLKSQISDPNSQIPVNTQCAICGMAVDPKLPTVTYRGKTIGFGCKICPPKFAAEPDKYGPLYLRNETIKR